MKKNILNIILFAIPLMATDSNPLAYTSSPMINTKMVDKSEFVRNIEDIKIDKQYGKINHCILTSSEQGQKNKEKNMFLICTTDKQKTLILLIQDAIRQSKDTVILASQYIDVVEVDLGKQLKTFSKNPIKKDKNEDFFNIY